MCARQSPFIFLFVSCTKGGYCVQNVLAGNLDQHEKDKNVPFVWQVPGVAEVIGDYDTERRNPDASDSDMKSH